ncbi:MAG: NAD(P)H-dependent glycerol-3-phosphate dehydrogenase [Lautropia sp.]
MKIAILGAGAWGTALAVHAAARHDVTLWGRTPAVADAIEQHRRNPRYLPDVALPPRLRGSSDLAAALAGADLVVIATAIAGLRPTLSAVAAAGTGGAPEGTSDQHSVVWLSKGLEAGSGALPHQVAAEVMPGWTTGCLSGPSFAQEVAAGLPVALAAATASPSLGQRMVEAFHHGAMRIYRTGDLVGVEIAGALKNVMAIATGIGDGLGLGLNARAALMTRGLAEITRLGIALGAQPETFLGLAGVGDLVLTCTGGLSRNRTVGLQLAAGRPLAEILAGLGHVAEGVACCRAVVERAAALGVELPISSVVLDVLDGRSRPADAVAALLAREPRAE